MPVIIVSKSKLAGTVTPPGLNVETAVVEMEGIPDDFIVEGYIDLSQLEEGDEVIVKEYIAVDGANYGLFVQTAFSGSVPEPVIRFHTKTLLYGMKYKVTITQLSGSLKTFPYGFIIEVIGVE